MHGLGYGTRRGDRVTTYQLQLHLTYLTLYASYRRAGVFETSSRL
jgi:hypothetical protein